MVLDRRDSYHRATGAKWCAGWSRRVTADNPIATLADLDGLTVVTVGDVARLLGIARSTAYEAAQRGEFPVRRVGRRLLVPVPALREWLGVHAGFEAPDDITAA